MKYLFLLVVLIILFFAFMNWFQIGLITAGDLGYVDSITKLFHNFSLYAWDLGQGNGLGGNGTSFLWISVLVNFPIVIFQRYLHLPYEITERVTYLYPFLILSFISSFILVRKLIKGPMSILASLIYTTNTYILMVIGGGQVLIGLAYSIAPFILCSFIKTMDLNPQNGTALKVSLVTGLLFALQVLFDVRIAYITFVGVLIFFVMYIFLNYKQLLKNHRSIFVLLLSAIIIPIGVAVLLHAFWLLPVIIVHQNPIQELGTAYSTTGAVQFFSFAKFENTLSLLHPNWPENIFGKVGFMRPEFLIIPIIAFASLLFIKKESKERKIAILAFALIGIVGAFLAKGAQDPFGGVYLWMFDHVPGFIMFRDPTKWYVLVAVSYSVLIPYSIWKIYELLKSKQKFNAKNKIFNLQNAFVVLFLLFWLFTIRQAVFGQLGGTFKTTSVPQDYIKLEQFLNPQTTFSRTLWIPATQRFGFYSNTHPEISAMTLYDATSTSAVLKKFQSSQTEKFLQDAAVKYVIVPDDSQKEIFLKDRVYDNSQYLDTINSLEHIPWLKEINGFGKIKVFQVPDPKNHFWLSGGGTVTFVQINPTQYEVTILNGKKDTKLIFSEGFDKNWIMNFDGMNNASEPFEKIFNSFTLPKTGSYKAEVYYEPQTYVKVGMVVSIVTLIIVIVCLVVLQIRNKKTK